MSRHVNSNRRRKPKRVTYLCVRRSNNSNLRSRGKNDTMIDAHDTMPPVVAASPYVTISIAATFTVFGYSRDRFSRSRRVLRFTISIYDRFGARARNLSRNTCRDTELLRASAEALDDDPGREIRIQRVAHYPRSFYASRHCSARANCEKYARREAAYRRVTWHSDRTYLALLEDKLHFGTV